jgi:cytochrome c biogenesis protein
VVRGQPSTVFPDDKQPLLSMFVYKGDLGLDTGVPQSVYNLDLSKMKQVKGPDGKDFRVDMFLGQTVTLPDGLGSITLDRVDRYVKLQISRNPLEWMALVGMILALMGLLGSLFIKPRRVWVSVRRADGRTLVEVAGLDRSSGGNLSGEIDDLAQKLEAQP